MANTKKTTTKKTTAATKKTTERVTKVEKPIETPIEETVETPVTKEVVVEKEFKSDDLIPCRSMTRGELLMVGKKTKEVYVWAEYGDVTEVEYQDLLALKASKSAFIFDVMFFIEDEDLINTAKWNEVKKLYEEIYADDVTVLLEMDNKSFESALNSLPKGLKKAVITEIATRMEEGTFDSLQKIRIVDSVCGTDLNCLLR